jgi:hypothetical protein
MFEFVTSNNEWRCHYVDTHYFSGAHGLLSTFTFNMNCFEKYLHGLGSIFNRKIWLNWKWHYWKTEKSFSIKSNFSRGCRCRDRMVVGFTTTYVISAYHHWCCEFKSRSGQGVKHVIKFVSDLRQVSGSWVLRFPPPIKLTAMTIAEILLKVALNTIKQKLFFLSLFIKSFHLCEMTFCLRILKYSIKFNLI